MTRLKSEGICLYCGKMFSQRGIGSHLSKHLIKQEKEAKTSGKAYHLYISAAEMFLHLLMDGKARLADLDSFLRGIWLECCGHMSSFRVKGKEYDIDWDTATDFGEKMASKASSVFQIEMKLGYEYDFGSTTYLEVRVMGEYQLSVPQSILLLSRNEPLPIMCQSCNKKPAVTICSVCLFHEAALFCRNCAKKHAKTCSDFADYAEMPVVNSPRMGVCGYEGGEIDRQRDGVMVM